MSAVYEGISDRKLRILTALIDDYIDTAAPVGSRTIAKKYETAFSSATIRNEMSDLEDMGFLEQPHVSSGRIPSSKAYRLYASRLLEEPPDGEDYFHIRDSFFEHFRQMQDAVESAAIALCETTRLTSFVVMPKQLDLRITCLQLVPMSRGAALLVIITDGGVIRNQSIHVAPGLDQDSLYAISRTLTDRLAGHTLEEVVGMLSSYSMYSGGDENVCLEIAGLAKRMAAQTANDTVEVYGSHNILNYPEFNDTSKARAFLSVLENRDRLLDVFPSGIRSLAVKIGDETGVPELYDCAVATIPYSLGGDHKGTIGVIGPCRMAYKGIFNALRAIGHVLDDIMGGQ